MKAAIIMGSKSDYPVVEKAEEILKEFGVDYELRVLSAHRTPRQAEEFARTAEDRGVEVIIAAAGKAAHLAGVIAGNTPVPVIGIPMKTSDLGGMDSLLSVVQMPKRGGERSASGRADPERQVPGTAHRFQGL